MSLSRPAPGALLLALILAVAPNQAPAHPHVFIDGGVDFVFNDAGEVTGLRVTWIYDHLSSLVMLEDLAIDGAAPLSPESRAALAAYQTEWHPDFEGDSYLYRDAARVPLSGPVAPDASVEGYRVTITFERRLEAPIPPGPELEVRVYDPTYYTAYQITEAPALAAAPAGCGARVASYQPTASLAAMQQSLLSIPADADPAENIGALFAERVYLRCD